jgi:dinuclear metal center YbgI/SA1388 family protein
MILKELILDLDKIFQKDLALEWDRVGLQIGNSNSTINKILVTLDVDDELIDEAISSGTNLIISHHPAVFEEMVSITDYSGTGSMVLKLIENSIAVYAAHTNYDIMDGGLNDIIASKLGLEEIRAIEATSQNWYKFVIFVPVNNQEEVRRAICKSGGGKIGDYSCCTFSSRGRGTFLPGKDAQPYIGKTGELSEVDEVRMECIVGKDDLHELSKAVIEAHPYEEPAYDIYRLENQIREAGPGRIGKLKDPVILNHFIRTIRKNLDLSDVGIFHRGVENTGNRMIENVAVVSGSCNSLIGELAALDCDLIITGEISYHNAISLWESGKIVAVLGHGTIEKHAIEGIYDKLKLYFEKNNLDIELIKTKWGYWDWRYDIGRR